uniref:MYM-type domain-containing protein n=1 Tax=viral metagenome TaxID=1070528 RepID=A0A6C0FEA4_9ZZZZ|tara:strand:+ start:28817 stop:29473 length:657 start_codon:yes stop_codon:yes gene_type:complete
MEPKKKRGRKPKNNVIINENPKFDHEKVDNLISSLNVKSNQNHCSIDEFNGIDNYTNHQVVNSKSNKSVCWNCNHQIEENISYPINYINGTFYMNGSFCCYSCAGRYLFDTYHGEDLFKKYSLLNLYYNKVTNTRSRVKIAPEKIQLDIFGGTLTHQEYIDKSSTTNIQNGFIPPSIYINHSYSKTQTKEVNVFKMYRKKSQNQNKIFKEIEIEEAKI